MSGLFKQFKTNQYAEVNGVRIEFAEATNDDGSIPTFIIGRMGKSNKEYTKTLEAKTRPHRRHIELNIMKNEVADTLFKDVFISTILKGWENVQDADGSPLEFNKANAEMLMTALPDVYARLQEEAALSANFRDEALEEESKN